MEYPPYDPIIKNNHDPTAQKHANPIAVHEMIQLTIGIFFGIPKN